MRCDEPGIVLAVFARRGKTRPSRRAPEHVEDLRRPRRVGAVVESDRDLVLAAGALMVEDRVGGEVGVVRAEQTAVSSSVTVRAPSSRVSSTVTISPRPTLRDRVAGLERAERLERRGGGLCP